MTTTATATATATDATATATDATATATATKKTATKKTATKKTATKKTATKKTATATATKKTAVATAVEKTLEQANTTWQALRQAGNAMRLVADNTATDIASRVASESDTEELQALWNAARSEYVVADQSSPKLPTGPITQDWTLFSKRAREALKKRGFTPYFPEINSGRGRNGRPDHVILVAVAEDQAQRKIARLDQDKRDREALAAGKALAEEAKQDAVRAMSAEEVATALAEMCKLSGNSVADVVALLPTATKRAISKRLATATAKRKL